MIKNKRQTIQKVCFKFYLFYTIISLIHYHSKVIVSYTQRYRPNTIQLFRKFRGRYYPFYVYIASSIVKFKILIKLNSNWSNLGSFLIVVNEWPWIS